MGKNLTVLLQFYSRDDSWQKEQEGEFFEEGKERGGKVNISLESRTVEY